MYEHDVIVVGAGGAGLRAAIAAHEEGADVAIVSKLHPVRSHTGAAEGGINAALREGDSWEDHAYDTMKGSDYLADAPAAETLCKDSPKETIKLEHWGMAFSRDDDGRVSQRPFGGLSFPRTTYAGAETGHQLLHTMYEQLVKRGIKVYDEWHVTRLAVSDEENPEDRTCHGIVAYDVQTGTVEGFSARNGVILATGGLGQVYDHTTNAVANTGDGVAMAYRAGVPMEDMEFIQFHPTTLPSTGVLITEGVRGEGGILYNEDGERFMFEYGYANNLGELASRDVVARAELTEVNEGRGIEDEYVHLDMRHLGEERIIDRLENIIHLSEDFEGVNPVEAPMPVKPGQHYAMGGIETDENGETCITGLYAAGECACASVHGGNRLGGNALPELIVFGKRAGHHAAGKDMEEARITTGKVGDYETAEVESPVQLGEAGIGEDAVADGGAAADSGAAATGTDLVQQAVEDERETINHLLEKEDGIQHAEIRERVQQSMTQYVNVFREEEGLKQALRDIREARELYQDVFVGDKSRTFNTDLLQTLETRNILDIAEAITLGALARNEFRGAHWRKEYQERRDEEWLKHTLLSWNDGKPELWYKPVILEGESKTYEPKVRSY
ncbi:FAD-binding protein [Haloferax mediterranei ATCC 33500]|uniref:succinate dehydrogenase n=1 Tax=Haloferax mediterranei (strain ATCC 33500 / DSM 1411 / JCM 8866 / NBRC 14739 / NCIMB 2177 / R-4) TaxID=523841 RepID=I3R8D5_HALMT|nr:FAD-binding protein [Haloferax mediterranei]AFK20495.1 succinate dehydrogenase, subunit A (flavoprotein) [Haloferax mediterranei ATCC 33500]AHZ23854.1 succinate dehydrogenase [Haloferax mediterranei ATCC 33500]ELZ98278.1 succinate dehydrogenase or fumarate reductase, flavoprotein subunit [Haloferax mediterranei ATCC 33500]MDX5986749.1 FAD-binding protein [Haloferax mediterranei ATCC 33500]QCQ76073.1 FAD-binding protein [Haloferax mediterranei ATCC 33500]